MLAAPLLPGPGAPSGADLQLLKEELTALVSSFLVKEPKLQAMGGASTFPRDEYGAAERVNLEGLRSADGQQVNEPAERAPEADDLARVSGGCSSEVERLRLLVHTISAQDGEFCLKLALYLRHELSIRQTANFIAALCAREEKAVGFLGAYLERLLVLPSDWLAVANFAYFYDNDYEHQKYSIQLRRARDRQLREKLRRQREALARPKSAGYSAPSHRANAPVKDGWRSRSQSPPLPTQQQQQQQRQPLSAAALAEVALREEERREDDALRKPFLPAALRKCLVDRFASFDEFALAKYNNEAAEKKKRVRRARADARKRIAAIDDELAHPQRFNVEGDEAQSDSRRERGGDYIPDDRSSSGTSLRSNSTRGTDARALAQTPPRYDGHSTFTYKQLVRMLHITRPAYAVCCILGKRYPPTEEAFNALFVGEESAGAGRSVRREGDARTADGSPSAPVHQFDHSLAGTRMRLPVPETWETQLASRGNTGDVWDDLVRRNQLPYMATLRNLRNILTRRCLAGTHAAVLEKLQSESAVARSRQLPYRFYSAYQALESAQADYDATVQWQHECELARRRGRGGRGAQRGRRGGRAGRHGTAALPQFPRKVGRVGVKRCESSLGATDRPAMECLWLQYRRALDRAIATATRLNVIPVKGFSVVILRVTETLLEPLRAAGADAAMGSLRTKLEVASLLSVMMMRACERCVLLLSVYDTFMIYDAASQRAVSPEDDTVESADGTSSSNNSSSRDSTCAPHVDSMNGAMAERVAAPLSPDVNANCDVGGGIQERSILSDVSALVHACTRLLQTHDDAPPQVPHPQEESERGLSRKAPCFPFAFLDEVIERRTQLESLVVIDDGGHHTYTGMNRRAPALGDLPVYLARLRRTCSPRVVFVGVALSAAAAASAASDPAKRYSHRNDILLTGFSDAILRLVAERSGSGGGGVLASVERAAESFGVQRGLTRHAQLSSAERRTALQWIRDTEAGDGTGSARRAPPVRGRMAVHPASSGVSSHGGHGSSRGVLSPASSSSLPVAATRPTGDENVKESSRADDGGWRPQPGPASSRAVVSPLDPLLAGHTARPAEQSASHNACKTPPSPALSPERTWPSSTQRAKVAKASRGNGRGEVSSSSSGRIAEQLTASPTWASTLKRHMLDSSECDDGAQDDDDKTRRHAARTESSKLLLGSDALSSAATLMSLSWLGTAAGAATPAARSSGQQRVPVWGTNCEASLSAAEVGDTAPMRPDADNASDEEADSSARSAPWPEQAGPSRRFSPVGAGASRHVMIYHPTSFITLSQVSGGDEGAMTLKYALRNAARRRLAAHVANPHASITAATTTTANATNNATVAAHTAKAPPGQLHVELPEERKTKSVRFTDATEKTRHPLTASCAPAAAAAAADGGGGGGGGGAGSTLGASVPSAKPPASLHSSAPIPRRLQTNPYLFRECRFFISSTFLDMNNERNALVLDVFPRIRRWAAESGIKVTVIDVDLRWGITALSTTENLSTSVCLNEVSRCAPFFLGILGSRYGSCPPSLQVVADEDVDMSDYAWLSEIPPSLEGRISVTELEMRHGLYTAAVRWNRAVRDSLGLDASLKQARPLFSTPTALPTGTASADGSAPPLQAPPSVLFFCRDFHHLMQSLPNDERRKVYEPDSAQAMERISGLKSYIRSRGVTIVDYKAAFLDPSAYSAGATAEEASAHAADGQPVGSPGAADKGRLAGPADSVDRTARGLLGTALPDHAWSSSAAVMSTAPFVAAAALASVQDGGVALPALPAVPRSVPASGARGGETTGGGTSGRFLTSQDVLIGMSDFTNKAFNAVRNAIAHVRWTPPAVETRHGSVADAASVSTSVGGLSDASKSSTGTPTPPPAPAQPSAGRTALVETERQVKQKITDLFSSQTSDLLQYARELNRLYVPPSGLIERMARAVLGASERAHAPGAASTDERSPGTASSSSRRRSEAPPWLLHTGGTNDTGAAASKAGLQVSSGTTNVLVVEAAAGDGKSSAVAALAHHLSRKLGLMDASTSGDVCVVYYAVQATDGSLRSLLLYLAMSLVLFAGMQDAFQVLETDTTRSLLDLLPRLYEAMRKRGKGAVVLLDGLDSSPDSDETVKHLGLIVSPAAAPHIQFVLSSIPLSSLSMALQSRVPPATTVAVPTLEWPERAEIVRRHLANYGKRLQESAIEVNELKGLLRKADASRVSYLTSAITYLRLFSTFDTLRSDIRQLPSTTSQLFVQLVCELERRFGAVTCRLVLTTLYLRQSVGGVMEYNLYRLVSNVAVASKLVALLTGTCISSTHGRLLITGSFFESAIAATYLASAAERREACENMLASDLTRTPLRATKDTEETRLTVRAVIESIRANAIDPSVSCILQPARYSPRELLALLHSAVLAGRADVATTLVAYLPFHENLLKDASMWQRLMNLLPQLLRQVRVNERLAANVAALIALFHENYHILSVRPDLLLQCRLNSPIHVSALSRFDSATIARVAAAAGKQGRTVSSSAAPPAGESGGEVSGLAVSPRRADMSEQTRASGALGITQDTRLSPTAKSRGEFPTADPTVEPVARSSPAASTPTCATAAADPASWVRWNNRTQHGGQSRVTAATPSASPILCMALSADGCTIALGCEDCLVRLASSSSPEHITATLKHVAGVTAISFLQRRGDGAVSRVPIAGATPGADRPSASSHGRDGFLVSGCQRGLFYVWGLADGTLLQVGAAHLREISCTSCHPLENVVCTGGLDTYCMLWNVLGTTSSLSTALEGYAQRVLDAEESARTDCRPSAAEGGEKDSAADGAARTRRLLQDFTRTPGSTLGKFALTSLGETQASLRPFAVLRHSSSAIASVAFHQSGEVLATGSWDGSVCLIQLLNFARPPAAEQTPPRDPANSSANDYSRGAPAPGGDTTEARLRLPYESHGFLLGAPVRRLCFMPSSVITCAVGLYTGTVVLIDQASGIVSATLTTLHHCPVTELTFSADGRLMASADAKGRLTVTYAGVAGTALCTMSAHQVPVTGLRFFRAVSDGGEAGSSTASAFSHSPLSGYSMGGGHGGASDSLFSGNGIASGGASGLLLMSASTDRTVQSWELTMDSARSNYDAAGSAAIGSGGGDAVAHAGPAGVARTESHSSVVTCLAASSDGRRFVTGCADGMAFVFTDSAAEESGAEEAAAYASAARGREAATSLRSRLRAAQRSSCASDDDEEEEEERRRSEECLRLSFTLSHDGCRVSCLSFGLNDTRILVGVAFGYVYVWSSTPGLDRREGRLLQCVRVPPQGLFPVVAIESNDIQDTLAAVRDRLGRTLDGHDAAAEEDDTYDSDSPQLYGSARSSRARLPPASVAQVVALCSNGDTGKFCMYSDSVSVALYLGASDRHSGGTAPHKEGTPRHAWPLTTSQSMSTAAFPQNDEVSGENVRNGGALPADAVSRTVPHTADGCAQQETEDFLAAFTFGTPERRNSLQANDSNQGNGPAAAGRMASWSDSSSSSSGAAHSPTAIADPAHAVRTSSPRGHLALTATSSHTEGKHAQSSPSPHSPRLQQPQLSSQVWAPERLQEHRSMQGRSVALHEGADFIVQRTSLSWTAPRSPGTVTDTVRGIAPSPREALKGDRAAHGRSRSQGPLSDEDAASEAAAALGATPCVADTAPSDGEEILSSVPLTFLCAALRAKKKAYESGFTQQSPTGVDLSPTTSGASMSGESPHPDADILSAPSSPNVAARTFSSSAIGDHPYARQSSALSGLARSTSVIVLPAVNPQGTPRLRVVEHHSLLVGQQHLFVVCHRHRVATPLAIQIHPALRPREGPSATELLLEKDEVFLHTSRLARVITHATPDKVAFDGFMALVTSHGTLLVLHVRHRPPAPATARRAASPSQQQPLDLAVSLVWRTQALALSGASDTVDVGSVDLAVVLANHRDECTTAASGANASGVAPDRDGHGEEDAAEPLGNGNARLEVVVCGAESLVRVFSLRVDDLTGRGTPGTDDVATKRHVTTAGTSSHAAVPPSTRERACNKTRPADAVAGPRARCEVSEETPLDARQLPERATATPPLVLVAENVFYSAAVLTSAAVFSPATQYSRHLLPSASYLLATPHPASAKDPWMSSRPLSHAPARGAGGSCETSTAAAAAAATAVAATGARAASRYRRRLRWVAGDCNGSVYQLRLETVEDYVRWFLSRTGADMRTRGSRRWHDRTPSLGTALGDVEDDENAEMYSLLLQRRRQQIASDSRDVYGDTRSKLADCAGTPHDGPARVCSGSVDGVLAENADTRTATFLRGWAWSAGSPFEWLRGVDFATHPLARELGVMRGAVASAAQPSGELPRPPLQPRGTLINIQQDLQVLAGKQGGLSSLLGEYATDDEMKWRPKESLSSLWNELSSSQRSAPAELPSLYTDAPSADSHPAFHDSPTLVARRLSSTESCAGLPGAAPTTMRARSPPSPTPAATLSSVSWQSADLGGAARDSVSYFGILQHATPPTGMSVTARTAWVRQQQAVLKEAMRVQHYNPDARAALEAYNRRVTLPLLPV